MFEMRNRALDSDQCLPFGTILNGECIYKVLPTTKRWFPLAPHHNIVVSIRTLKCLCQKRHLFTMKRNTSLEEVVAFVLTWNEKWTKISKVTPVGKFERLLCSTMMHYSAFLERVLTTRQILLPTACWQMAADDTTFITSCSFLLYLAFSWGSWLDVGTRLPPR